MSILLPSSQKSIKIFKKLKRNKRSHRGWTYRNAWVIGKSDPPNNTAAFVTKKKSVIRALGESWRNNMSKF